MPSSFKNSSKDFVALAEYLLGPKELTEAV
jgi:hypothetical protein